MKKLLSGKRMIEQNLLPFENYFDVRGLLNRFYSQFSGVAGYQGILLEISVSEQTPSYLVGDPLRVNDLLKNLFAHALNHLDNGCICFNIDAVPVHSEEYRLEITVTTSGGGIPHYELGAIFQPAVSGKRDQCTLYIAKTLAGLMRGDLIVENTFGWGTKYFTYLIMKAVESGCYGYQTVKLGNSSGVSQLSDN